MKNFLKSIYNLIPFKKQLFLLLRPFSIPKSIYQHLYFKAVFKVKFKDRQFLIEHFGYQIENELFWSGLTNGWEKISMRLWIELCSDSKTIIDVGANTGIYSLVAKAANPDSKVYGFEPVKRVFEKYQKNCDLNHFDVKCLDYALSNFDGEAVIYDSPSEHVYSVTVNKNTAPHVEKIETKIQTKKLSTFIKEFNIKNIDLIKIDVETHEPEVLEGMEEYLKAFQPTLLIEILNDEIGERVQEIIRDIDYLYFNIDEVNIPKRVDKIIKSDYYNYLICKKEVAVKLNLLNG
jgi:FkbM family methyltransferase